MRVFANGRGTHPDIAGHTHAWTFAQTAAADYLLDLIETPNATLQPINNPGTSTDCPIETCRTFNGTNQYFMGSADGANAADFGNGHFGAMAWIKIPGTIAGSVYVGGYGGDGTGAGKQVLFCLFVDKDGVPHTIWQQSDFTWCEAYTSNAAIPFDEWCHLAVNYGDALTVDFYVNGVLFQSIEDPGCPSSSGSPVQRWYVGKRPDAASYFTGSMDSLVVKTTDRFTAAEIQQAYRDGMGWHYATTDHVKVEVEDQDGNWTDLSSLRDRDWLSSVELHDDVDAQGISGTVKLFREMGDASLAKYNDNTLNRTPLSGAGPDDTTYTKNTSELLALGRRIKAHYARTPWGISPRTTPVLSRSFDFTAALPSDLGWTLVDPYAQAVETLSAGNYSELADGGGGSWAPDGKKIQRYNLNPGFSHDDYVEVSVVMFPDGSWYTDYVALDWLNVFPVTVGGVTSIGFGQQDMISLDAAGGDLVGDPVVIAAPLSSHTVALKRFGRQRIEFWFDGALAQTYYNWESWQPTVTTPDDGICIGCGKWVSATVAVARADWNPILDGVIDDIDWAAPEITLQVQDLITQRLTAAYFEAETVYSDTTGNALEDEMQDMLDDCHTNGWVADDPATGGATTLQVPVSPDWFVKQWQQRREPPLQALNTLAEQIGWAVRRKWYPKTQQFELVLCEPERTRTIPNTVLTGDDYEEIRELKVGLSRIRNVVRIQYYSNENTAPTSGESHTGYTVTNGGVDGTSTTKQPHWVQWIDAASVAAYGRQFCEVAEAGTSNIDTVDEADRMAKSILLDLKDPKADHTAAAVCRPEIEVGDYPRWIANGEHYTGDQDLAVVQWSLSLGEKASMDIRCRGTPCGGSTRHLGKETRGANGKPPTLDGKDVATGISTSNVMLGSVGLLKLSDHLRSSRFSGMRNQDFSDVFFGGSGPPDGWTLTGGGAWNTDAAISTTCLSGGRSVAIKTATGVLQSDIFPVQDSSIYLLEAWWKSASAMHTVTSLVNVVWYSDRGVTPIAVTAAIATANAGLVWSHDTIQCVAPATSRYASIQLARTSGSYDALYDRVAFTPIRQNCKAYLGSDAAQGAKTGTVQVNLGAESWDRGSIFNASALGHAYAFESPNAADWEITAGARIAPIGANVIYAQAILYKDGAPWIYGPVCQNFGGTDAVDVQVVTGPQPLVATNYVQLYLRFSDVSGNPTIKAGADVTWMSAKMACAD